jgi:hypothetical protein
MTLLLKPFTGVIVIVLLPLEPCVIVRLFGDAEREKSGCAGGADAFTARVMFVVRVKLPDVPVTVTVAVPKAAVLLAVSVKVLLLVAGFWLNEAVTPPGKLADKLTLPLKPFVGVIVIVLFPLEPWVIVKLLGDADKEKSGWLGGAEPGQFFTKFAALMVPIPVAKSQPTVVPKDGRNELFEVESTPSEPDGKKQLLAPVQFTSMSPCVTS